LDFEWSEEQLELKKACINFSQKNLNNNLIERDLKNVFPSDLWKKCGDFGIMGLPIPKKYGGQEQDILTTVLAMEGLGYGCKDRGLIFGLSAHIWDVQMPILDFGTEEQKLKYLPKLCRGDSIGAIAISEPDAGSDAFSLTTRAQKDGHRYILNGTKTFVTNGPVADIFLIFATVNKRLGFMGISTFIVEKNTPGLHVGKNIGKMGLKTNPWSELFFDDCIIPAENLLAKEGNGVAIFNDSMEWERSCILAGFIGSMERQLEICVKYVNDRKQFKKPIGKFQAIANKIVDMKVRLETARLLLYRSAWLKEKKGTIPLEAAMTKLYISESWLNSCLSAVQIHGGYGYTTEFELERELRDSVGSTIFAGTSEIQRNIIAQQLGI
jgi:alkylation response protein AidB-like acyl-CoA dehydrogenase